MIALPCSPYSFARFFPCGGDDPGPPPLYTKEHPDGLPLSEIDPAYHDEFRTSQTLLERTVALAYAAHSSPSRATIIFEHPADRSISGSPQSLPSSNNHGSVFGTQVFKRFVEALGKMSSVTFAQCRFGGAYQKYTTLYYSNDAHRVLGNISGPNYQCNHPKGTHRRAGGKLPGGNFASEDAAAYPDDLISLLVRAFTFARTGSTDPIKQVPAPNATTEVPPVKPNADSFIPPLANTDAPGRDAELPSTGLPPTPKLATTPDVTPRAISFTDSAAPQVSTPTVPPPTPMPMLPSSPAPARTGLPSPSVVHHFPARAVRTSTRSSNTTASEQLRDAHAKADRRAQRAAPVLPAVPGSPAEQPPSYVSFTGTPMGIYGNTDPVALIAEALAESIASYASAPDGEKLTAPKLRALIAETLPEIMTADETEASLPVGGWIDLSSDAFQPINELCGEFNADSTACVVDSSEMRDALMKYAVKGNLNANAYKTAYAFISEHLALRADSDGAPSTFKQAHAAGEPWHPTATSKEMSNHKNNESWTVLGSSELPKGRRLHKFVWVFKMKRDGTAKARLCVQGCTMVDGIDYDQVFSAALRYGSARGLFAFAARKGCRVHSIDFVAAYLQGEFMEGEVIYCHMPPGFEELGPDGKPMIVRIDKPIYGIPQAGRRLQRKVFPWLRSMGLRQLDDSDSCVWVYDDPRGKEVFALGVYVDNLQIVHSAELREHGRAVDKNSFYAKFVNQLGLDWDIVDEGPMCDMLGMQVRRNDDGSFTLHQEKYITKLLERFKPIPNKHASRDSLPYSSTLLQNVEKAIALPTSDGPAYPDLVKPMQCRIGALMYSSGSCRPDIAYPVHQLARCMARPTPEALSECDFVLNYLGATRELGITYSSSPTDTLSAMADASWEVKNSTSGWCLSWQDASLAYGSRKQHCVSLSSTEAEIVALSEAAKDVIFYRKFLRGLDPSAVPGPTPLATDNTGARDLSYNPEHHDKTKHIARRHFYVRDMVECLEIVVPFVPTKLNLADFFTKSLDIATFQRHRNAIMNIPSGAP